MEVNIITKEDLQEFKTELLEDIKNLFNIKISEQKIMAAFIRGQRTSENFYRNITESPC